MAWPELRYDQTNLRRLCRERSVYPTEYQIQNRLYGLDALLREYAGLADDEPLPWALEHCISFDNPEPYFADVQSKLPIVLAISEGQAAVLRPHRAGPVHAIGAAYFYMRELYRRRHGVEAEVERRGTLVFPDKSTTHQDTDFDRARMAEQLAALPAEFQPVAVSVFWRDYQRGTHRPFARAGLQVVSSGHPYDPLFLFRQYDMCRQFKYACANDLSTSFCLSVLSGCRFFHWPTGALKVSRAGVTQTYAEEPTLHLPGKQACIAASPYPPRGDGAEQRRLAAQYAGQASVRPPEFFQALLPEGRRLLQVGTPAAVRFRGGLSLMDAAAWRTHGIDADGWARPKCGFVIPAHQCRGRVRFSLEIPARWRIIPQRAHLIVKVDGRAAFVIKAGTGRWLFDVPAPNLDRPCPVTVECNARFRIGIGLRSEPRQRALRVAGIEWLADPAAAAPLGWRQVA